MDNTVYKTAYKLALALMKILSVRSWFENEIGCEDDGQHWIRINRLVLKTSWTRRIFPQNIMLHILNDSHSLLQWEVKQPISKENSHWNGNMDVWANTKIQVKIQEGKLKVSDAQKDTCFKIISEANTLFHLH